MRGEDLLIPPAPAAAALLGRVSWRTVRRESSPGEYQSIGGQFIRCALFFRTVVGYSWTVVLWATASVVRMLRLVKVLSPTYPLLSCSQSTEAKQQRFHSGGVHNPRQSLGTRLVPHV